MTHKEISTRRLVTWKDPITGKPRRKSKKFSQIMNQWNILDGVPKDEIQIRYEINLEADKWMEKFTASIAKKPVEKKETGLLWREARYDRF